LKIGIISNSFSCVPSAYSLLSQGLKVNIFFSPSLEEGVTEQVIGFCKQYELNITTEKNKEKDLYKWINEGSFTVCFLIGYGRLILLHKLSPSKPLLYNIHFGLLPAFRGPSPVFWQLKKGNTELGLCMHVLSEKFDAGNVVWQKTINRQPHFNYTMLTQLFAQLAAEGLVYSLRFIQNHIPLPILPASTAPSGYQKKPALTDVLINWTTMEANTIVQLVNACNAWNKGALAVFKGEELKIIDAKEEEYTEPWQAHWLPGTILQTDHSVKIACCNQQILSVNMFFYRGFYLPAYHAVNYGIKEGEKIN